MKRNHKINEKIINGAKLKISIVVSQFNKDITEKMLSGALQALKLNNVKDGNINVVEVPGSFEIPLACQKLAQSKKYDGIVALGCVIKGGTDHYYYIAGEASRGVMNVMLKYNIPIGFGIITANNLKQAIVRSSGKHNKGKEAAIAVLEMMKVL